MKSTSLPEPKPTYDRAIPELERYRIPGSKANEGSTFDLTASLVIG